MNHGLISIIVPVYKVERYLKKCLDSLIKQTYRNIEIILVDDGSPDSCPQLCDKYAQNDSRIKVIHKQNGGLSSARNAGLKIVSGDFVSFVDSDDWVNDNYIETLYLTQNKFDADLVIAEHQNVYEERTCSKSARQNNFTEKINRKESLKRLFCENNPSYTVAWGKLYRKQLLENFYFPNGKFHEDEFTTFLLFHKTNNICYTNAALYNYRQRTDNITSTQHPLDLLEAFENQYLFFKDKREYDFQAILLQHLCWQILYAFTIFKTENQIKRLQEKIVLYRPDIKIFKMSLFHTTCLTIFMKFPHFYVFLRRAIPFHIRRNS